ncbi:MAG: hypothetical protein KDA85_10805 [Planctomycetaceae bacterium]|nr:hypothetical protein [Planctomycetaceae bacterium]
MPETTPQDESNHQRIPDSEEGLLTIQQVSELILRQTDAWKSMDGIVQRLGEATRVSRVYLFDILTDEGHPIANRRYEWVSPEVSHKVRTASVQSFTLSTESAAGLSRTLKSGHSISGIVRQLPAGLQTLLIPQGVLSIALTPIMVQEHWHGFVGFDDCVRERIWSDSEISALKVFADCLGTAILRQDLKSLITEQESILDSIRRKSSHATRPINTLSPAERDVLNLVSAGEPNKAIAIELGIRPRTVEDRRKRVMEKLGVASFAELMRVVADAELLDH